MWRDEIRSHTQESRETTNQIANDTRLDHDLAARDIQLLPDADAVVSFFSALGYDTSARLPQTAAALGITADSIRTKVTRIERVANQENGALQVYLFQLDSVTVAATRGIVRALRDRAGNYLLVLTSDYQVLDFVLVEREVPEGTSNGISAPRVLARPRVLLVDRRNVGVVGLRVLRRFTYTEADVDAQYDKLLAAYVIADWSEPFYNNHALFADYYLNERLPALAEWAADPKPTYLRLRELFNARREHLATADDPTFRKHVIEPTFEALGFTYSRSTADDNAAPDYIQSSQTDEKPLVLGLSYRWNRSLDGKDELRDPVRPDDNPGARVVSVLQDGKAPWAIVTNGKVWRLYAAASDSRATSYYEVDLEECLGSADPNEAFRYFWLIFRAAAFQPRQVSIGGETRELSFVDQITRESADYARRLGERLKERTFEDVFPDLAKGFVAHIRHLDGTPGPFTQEQVDGVFHGTLILLYRVLFLLYAESRDLLPIRATRSYWEKSLGRLKGEIASTAGSIKDEAPRRLTEAYSAKPTETSLYDRLLELARIVDRGDPAVNTPLYDGGLFLTELESADQSPEADAARFLLTSKVPDRYLALALDKLARDVDEKRGDLVAIDYKSLGVRQLGSIYQGLLEFRLRIAPGKMAIVKGKKTEEIVPYDEAVKEKRSILTNGRGRNAPERTLAKGAPYLENDRRERKATGSYYTPDHIVKYIVEHAVGAALGDHLERLRPRFRDAQKAFLDAKRRQSAFQKQGMVGDDPQKVANDPRWQALVDDLFDFRALDPAMGSGHFLVEAIDYLTDHILDFLNGFPWNPVQARVQQTREAILAEIERQGVTIDRAKLTDVNLLKRYVLKRCMYGVDLNPMAVELAKVSVWLHCFTLGAPLSFLDHHLKCGNSLIGTTVDQVEDELKKSSQGHYGDLFGGPFQGLLTATSLIEELSHLPDATADETRKSHDLYAAFEREQEPYKAALDIWVSRYFGNKRAREYLTLVSSDYVEQIHTGGAKLSPEYRQVIATAADLRRTKRFFHWDLEFPEAFLDLRQKTWKPKAEQGFDAVVGNPPYDVLASEELGHDVAEDLAYFAATALYEPAIRGKSNLYKLFVCRGVVFLSHSGAFSFIVPMTLMGDDQAASVRRQLLTNTCIVGIEAFPQKDDPRQRVFPEAKLATMMFVLRAGAPGGNFSVRTHPGRFLDATTETLRVAPAEILAFDSVNAIIPSCNNRDWEIALKVIGLPNIKRLGDYCRAFQGEVNETTDGKKGFLSYDPKDGQQVLRGSMICLYAVREASQGDPIYLRKQQFLAGKPSSVKAHHFEQRRVGWQESSPQNNFRRLISAPIPRGDFCNHKINYVPESESSVSLDLLLTILNSLISDWFFRLGSTNAAVSHYQVLNLRVPHLAVDVASADGTVPPVDANLSEIVSWARSRAIAPGMISTNIANLLERLSRRIQEIESSRVLHSRTERSHLAPESQPIQDAINAVLFRCYGLTDDDARYVTQRLGEML